MQECWLFYVDDSGTKDLNRPQTSVRDSRRDWFALGGVLIREKDKATAEEQIANFRANWPELGDTPLHSYDIRNTKSNFAWLKNNPQREAFLGGLTDLMVGLPIFVLACVIDRPGYDDRYRERYGGQRWQLCRSAFSIVVERAAKLALHFDCRLRIFVERSDKRTEQQLREYYDELRRDGLPFSPATSARYEPLDSATLSTALYDFKVKTKKSDLMQIADLALWPVCIAGYDKTCRAYRDLFEAQKVLERGSALTDSMNDAGVQGLKYFCFDESVAPKVQKPM